MAGLVVIQGPTAQPVYEAPAGADLSIGRGLDNAMVLENAAVSRRHARVFVIDDAYWIEDLESSNGTRVNGVVITRAPLNSGDVVEIGPYRFRFEKAVTASAVCRRVPAETPPAGDALVIEEGRPAPGGAADGAATQGDAAQRPAEGGSGSAILAKVDTRHLAEARADAASLHKRLQVFKRFADSVGSLLDLDQVLRAVVESLFEIFTQTERAFVLLVDRETGRLTPRAVRNLKPRGGAPLTVSRTIVEQAMREGQGILLSDAASDERFARAASIIHFEIRSAMCVPLRSRNETYGVIHVDTTDPRAHFTEDDLYILAGVAAQAAVAVENANLHVELVRNQVRRHDMALASEVQRSFLPSGVPSVPQYEFFAHYAPAFEVGGDFYDFIHLPGEQVAVVLGDVPGKGFSAALMMAKLLSDIRHTALTLDDPRAVVERINLLLARSGSEKAFVTLLYLALDPANGRCAVVNAGHMAPLVRRADGRIDEPHETSGLPLGVDESQVYGREVIDLAPGESVLLYTDGISEARDAAERIYGAGRLRASLAGGPAGVAELGRHVLDDVQRFVGATVQSDDITLVGFGRTA
jgi:sigma-B regulation protein RsbU (phosphoserine phosphatase)